MARSRPFRLAHPVATLLLLAVGFSTAARGQSIQTVAGGGTDDGRLATEAQLVAPFGVAADAAGNVYFSDFGAHRVRVVEAATGRLRTVAGNGVATFGGDGGPALLASLTQPSGLVFDPAGGLLIADSGSYRIRRLHLASGTISTFLGGGSVTGEVDQVPAADVAFGFLASLAIDGSGNLWLAEPGENRVRRYDAASRIVRLVVSGPRGFAGDGGPVRSASFDTPRGLALDPTGNLYIADQWNHRVRRVDAATGIVTTVAGNGTQATPTEGALATQSGFNQPLGLAIERDGSLLVGDATGLYRVSAATRRLSRLSAGVVNDDPVVLPSGEILAVDSSLASRLVQRIHPSTGQGTVVAGGGLGGLGDGGPATAAVLARPAAVARGPAGDLFIAEYYGHRIRRVASGVISTFAGTGVAGTADDGEPRTSARLYAPVSIAVDGAGNLFSSDSAGRLVRFDASTGKVTNLGTYFFARLAVDPRNVLHVSQGDGGRVWRIDQATRQATPFAGTGVSGFSGDGGPATLAQLNDPQSLAFDAAGNLYVADRENYRIRRIDAATGIITTVAGGGSRRDWPVPALEAALDAPQAIALDGRGGLLVAGNSVLFRLDLASGIYSRVAGSYKAGSTGDGGPLSEATFTFVPGLFFDPQGSLFLADAETNRVRAALACAAVSGPALGLPADGAAGVSTGPTLSWSPVPGAFRYDVYLGTSSPPASAVAKDLAATTFTPLNLRAAATHFWRVVAKGDPFCVPASEAESAVRSFTTESSCGHPTVPRLVGPLDGAPGVASPVLLEWIPCCGAGSFDLYLGSTNPLPLAVAGLPADTQFPTQKYGFAGLAPGGLYYWSVLAHASCDPAKTAASSVRSFRVAGGGCPAPGAFSLSDPADGATDVSPDATLSWTASQNTTAYDLYLGLGATPPLHLAGLTGTSLALRGLSAGATYRWKVVARTPCDTAATTGTPVRSFTVRGTCTAPGPASFTFLPPGNVGAGQTYVVAWSAASELDAGGGYVVERSTSPSFSPLLDTIGTTSLFSSFVAPSSGSLYHRVRAVPACDPAKAGPWSPNGFVSVVSAKPNVVFSRAPEGLVLGLGERIEDRKTPFALENLTSLPLQVFVARQELQSPQFFTIVDPAGGDAAIVTLEPRVPKVLEIRYSGPRNDLAGSYQGFVVVAPLGAGLAVTPWAYVSLRIGASPDAVPQFRLGGVETEYASFPGLSGPDDGRALLSVDVHNPGSSPLELAAEVGPELWLELEPGWNATAIPPGASRSLRLSTRRIRAPNGSALPRYTYLTLRTKGGKTSRLLVQDNEAPLLSEGRGAAAMRPEASFLVPSVAHVTSALGNTFVSKLSLSNSGTEAVQAELVFTPASSDTTVVDGFGPSVRRATVLVPPNDVVRLSDPLVLLFGLTPPVSGTLEIRAPAARAGFLSVASSVDAPSSKGGTFGFALPVFRSGQGIRAGSSAAITAVAADAAERTNLILAETTGVDAAVATVSLLDREGLPVGSESVTVPRWGQRQLSGVVGRLGGAFGSRAGRLEISVSSGGGTLAAVTTVVDNLNDDAAAFAARAVDSQASVSKSLRALKPAWAKATGTVKSLVPALVNGYKTFPAASEPFTFRSVMGFTSLSSAAALFRLTYFDLASGAVIAREVRVPGRKTVEYTNILEQLFGIGTGVMSQGPLFVESDPNGLLWCRVASSLVEGTIGDSFPVVPVPSESLTGGSTARVLSIDGLEQSVDRSRGTRSNLILNEVSGKPLSLLVSLYEAGNRSSPVAERQLFLGPLEKLQLSTVFADLGLDQDDRRKDRTNVLCTVRALSGDGLASAVVTTIDNRTGDTRNIPLAPSGAGAGGVTIGF